MGPIPSPTTKGVTIAEGARAGPQKVPSAVSVCPPDLVPTCPGAHLGTGSHPLPQAAGLHVCQPMHPKQSVAGAQVW